LHLEINLSIASSVAYESLTVPTVLQATAYANRSIAFFVLMNTLVSNGSTPSTFAIFVSIPDQI